MSVVDGVNKLTASGSTTSMCVTTSCRCADITAVEIAPGRLARELRESRDRAVLTVDGGVRDLPMERLRALDVARAPGWRPCW
jgi:hypothetical protein